MRIISTYADGVERMPFLVPIAATRTEIINALADAVNTVEPAERPARPTKAYVLKLLHEQFAYLGRAGAEATDNLQNLEAGSMEWAEAAASKLWPLDPRPEGTTP